MEINKKEIKRAARAAFITAAACIILLIGMAAGVAMYMEGKPPAQPELPPPPREVDYIRTVYKVCRQQARVKFYPHKIRLNQHDAIWNVANTDYKLTGTLEIGRDYEVAFTCIARRDGGDPTLQESWQAKLAVAAL